eukprot:1159034-Pelagomonas_calceolata.AAC.7
MLNSQNLDWKEEITKHGCCSKQKHSARGSRYSFPPYLQEKIMPAKGRHAIHRCRKKMKRKLRRQRRTLPTSSKEKEAH